MLSLQGDGWVGPLKQQKQKKNLLLPIYAIVFFFFICMPVKVFQSVTTLCAYLFRLRRQRNRLDAKLFVVVRVIFFLVVIKVCRSRFSSLNVTLSCYFQFCCSRISIFIAFSAFGVRDSIGKCVFEIQTFNEPWF